MDGALIGSEFAGYRIDSVAGRGGMGLVYRATDLALDRAVALKLVAPELAANPGFRQRFIAESKVAASLDHPNVVPIYQAGECDGTLFLAMRFVPGDDLRTVIERDGPVAPARAAGIVREEGISTAAVAAQVGEISLTPTQRKILVALCRPLKISAYATPASNREIADEVSLSVDAVKAHLRVLFERLGIEDLPQNRKRTSLAAGALVGGLVSERDF